MSTVCYSPFPEVAESVQEELDTYRAQEDEVKRLKSIMVRHSESASTGQRSHSGVRCSRGHVQGHCSNYSLEAVCLGKTRQ